MSENDRVVIGLELHQFRLASQQLRDDIIAIWNNNPDITQFHLDDVDADRLDVEAFELLGRYIANNTHLEELDLSDLEDRLGDEGLSALLRSALTNGCSRRKLKFRGCELGTAGIRSMVPILSISNNLSELRLSNNRNINTEGFELLINALDGGAIEKIYLNGCNIDDISSLENCTLTNLQHLVLSHNNIQNVGSRSALEHYTSLEMLCLVNNSIGIDGCKTIANLLQKEDCSLIHLALDENDIGNEGAEILATSLKRNTKLIYFYLRENHIGERGYASFLKLLNDISSIASTCSSNHTLRALEFSYDEDFLPPVLREIRTLIELNKQFHTGREKVIQTQLSSQTRKRYCQWQGIEYTPGNIFVNIEPTALLPDILALISNKHGQSELYTALIPMVPDLMSYINREAMVNDEIAKNTVQINALTQQLALLNTKNSKLNERLAQMRLSNSVGSVGNNVKKRKKC